MFRHKTISLFPICFHQDYLTQTVRQENPSVQLFGQQIRIRMEQNVFYIFWLKMLKTDLFILSLRQHISQAEEMLMQTTNQPHLPLRNLHTKCNVCICVCWSTTQCTSVYFWKQTWLTYVFRLTNLTLCEQEGWKRAGLVKADAYRCETELQMQLLEPLVVKFNFVSIDFKLALPQHKFSVSSTIRPIPRVCPIALLTPLCSSYSKINILRCHLQAYSLTCIGHLHCVQTLTTVRLLCHRSHPIFLPCNRYLAFALAFTRVPKQHCH